MHGYTRPQACLKLDAGKVTSSHGVFALAEPYKPYGNITMSSFYNALLSSFSSITGRYDIKGQVASAGLWKVYSGTRKTTGQQVAIFVSFANLA